jgi:hypothetical protein
MFQGANVIVVVNIVHATFKNLVVYKCALVFQAGALHALGDGVW